MAFVIERAYREGMTDSGVLCACMIQKDADLRGRSQLDRFALTTLRRAVAAERKREDKLARHPREVQARRKIEALLAPKRG